MNEEQVKAVVSASVRETFLLLGFNITNPLEAQADMAALREVRTMINDEEWISDQKHVRKWRKLCEATVLHGWKTAVGIIVTFIFGAVAIGTALKAVTFR